MKPIYLQMVAALALSLGLGASATCAQQTDSSAPVAVKQTVGVPDINWLDSPQTPGDWRYVEESRQSLARFGNAASEPLFSLRCDKTTRQIGLMRGGAAGGESFMRIRAETADRILPVSNGSDHSKVEASLPATDSLLDAMAITKGRFAIEVENMEPLYLPAWAEVTRVIEDCRR